ncbi:MAG: ABC transporter ATP-binding protein [Nocardioides sp.]
MSAGSVGADAAPSPTISGAEVVRTYGLTMSYGAVRALSNLEMTQGAGVTGLVGANGAGKSTLIKILLGLLRPTAGRVSVLGHDPVTDGPAIRRAVGYMPEHDCLPPDVSASDFIVHLAQTSGLPRTAARERTADVLRHVGLAEERYRPMGGYSTGMKQRAKLAQALAHDPRLVLLDEPTNGLDPAAREEMLALVRRIGHDFGIAVLVTSHLLGELERVSDHVVVLDGGKLLRASATTDFMGDTGTLLVEVVDNSAPGAGPAVDSVAPDVAARAAMSRALRAAGVPCTPRGTMIAIERSSGDDSGRVYDLIRDAACDTGVGIVRIQADRHRIEDVFAANPRSGAGQVATVQAGVDHGV